MKESDIHAVVRFAASLGFKNGFAEATEAIKLLAERANNPESRKIAKLMATTLEPFSEEAHDAFLAELFFKIIFDENGSVFIQ